MRPVLKRTLRVTSQAFVLGALLTLLGRDAQAFTYVVQPGDTLAGIAERFYGRIQHEKLLVAANSLDAQGGSPIVPGMRLEIPSLTYQRVNKGDTWQSLASELLGAAHRSNVLAMANDTNSWSPPEEGEQLVIPYNLTIIAGQRDSLTTIAYEFLGNTNKAWELDHYNGLDGKPIQHGDVVLVPVTDLALSETGKRAAAAAEGSRCSILSGTTREGQLAVRAELPALIADVKSGRYVEAVRRGNRFLSSGELGTQTLAQVHRQLLEAYVALDALGLASEACTEWRRLGRVEKLDPAWYSPKILAACHRSGAAPH
jgi:LysM repeat protein